MKAAIDAQALRKTLAALRPKNRRFKSIREPAIRVISAPDRLVFIGTLASTSMVEAEIFEPGETCLPLEPIYRLLATYAKGARVVMETRGGRVYIDRLSFVLPAPMVPEE
jgi:hypothetical protein